MPRAAIEQHSSLPDLAVHAEAAIPGLDGLRERVRLNRMRREGGLPSPVRAIFEDLPRSHGYVVLARCRLPWSDELWQVEWVTPEGRWERRHVSAEGLALAYRRLLAHSQELRGLEVGQAHTPAGAGAGSISKRLRLLEARAGELSALLDIVVQGDKAAKRAVTPPDLDDAA